MISFISLHVYFLPSLRLYTSIEKEPCLSCFLLHPQHEEQFVVHVVLYLYTEYGIAAALLVE